MSKLLQNPVTPEAREAFTIYIDQWQEKLGLTDWRVHVSGTPSKRFSAEVYKCEYEDRLATIRLGTDFGSALVTPETVEALAVHELMHVMLKELIVLCQDSNTPDDVIRSAEHRIINSITRLLAPGAI